jgi:hypothetical protein
MKYGAKLPEDALPTADTWYSTVPGDGSCAMAWNAMHRPATAMAQDFFFKNLYICLFLIFKG